MGKLDNQQIVEKIEKIVAPVLERDESIISRRRVYARWWILVC